MLPFHFFFFIRHVLEKILYMVIGNVHFDHVHLFFFCAGVVIVYITICFCRNVVLIVMCFHWLFCTSTEELSRSRTVSLEIEPRHIKFIVKCEIYSILLHACDFFYKAIVALFYIVSYLFAQNLFFMKVIYQLE